MKLAKIPEAGKPKKIASTYPADEAAEVALYSKYYKEIYGSEVKDSELVRYIVKSFIENDKDFQKYKKSS